MAFTVSVIVAILSPVTVVGNILVLTAIWRNPSLRTPSYILLAGVAVTDLATGLLSMPFYVASALMPVQEPQFKIVKGFAVCFTSYFAGMTVLILTLVAIERWLHMTHRAMVTARRACYLVAVSFIFPIPTTVFRVMGQSDHRIALDIYSGLLLLFSLVVTTLAYCKIVRIIRSHQHRVSHERHPSINLIKYKKSVVSIVYILAVFYFSYAPLSILFAIFLIPLPKKHTVSGLSVLDVTMALVFLSSSLNPLLYLWRMKDIRDEVKRVVKRMGCKSININ